MINFNRFDTVKMKKLFAPAALASQVFGRFTKYSCLLEEMFWTTSSVRKKDQMILEIISNSTDFDNCKISDIIV